MTPFYQIVFSLFLMGFALSSGPCLISCGPLLISYIGAHSDSIKSGLKIYLVFCLARVFAYGVIGVLLGALGRFFLDKIYQTAIVDHISIIFGLFIVFVGISTMLSRYKEKNTACKRFENIFTKNKILNAVIFGLGFGFFPCAPLLFAISYILVISDTVWKGCIYALAFGLGTVVSPLFILSCFASSFEKIFSKLPKLLAGVRLILGSLMVFLGIQIIYRIISN